MGSEHQNSYSSIQTQASRNDWHKLIADATRFDNALQEGEEEEQQEEQQEEEVLKRQIYSY